jgi:hypothetical protein
MEYDRNANDKFKQKYPCNPTMDCGYLFWDGHQGQRLLKMDIEIQEQDLEGGAISHKKTPTKMRVTCTQYQEFLPEVFGNHYFREDQYAHEDVY